MPFFPRISLVWPTVRNSTLKPANVAHFCWINESNYLLNHLLKLSLIHFLALHNMTLTLSLQSAVDTMAWSPTIFFQGHLFGHCYFKHCFVFLELFRVQVEILLEILKGKSCSTSNFDNKGQSLCDNVSTPSSLPYTVYCGPLHFIAGHFSFLLILSLHSCVVLATW